jgi:hypothetical protein
MKRIHTLITLVLLLVSVSGLFSQSIDTTKNDITLFVENVFHLSEVMLHDVANPPAASRFYAYSILGAYEVMYSGEGKLTDLNSRFKEELKLVTPPKPKNLVPAFASIYAMLDVGKQIMPSGYLLEKEQQKLVDYFTSQRGISSKVIKSNISFAKEIATQVITYARSDGYNKLSTYRRYSPSKQEGRWYPTPPEYMAAIEPQWKTVRSFFLDSAAQFAPARPASFSTNPNSSFFLQMKEVYDVSKQLTQTQLEIANFWDCNPFAVDYSGHMAIGLKKISPGGHWIGITGIACSKAKLPLDSTILVHSMVALTLHDAFISCWEEKFKSDRIRPEAAINKYVDPAWRPVLQTPPFPEYTSGHSVASASAAVILTHFFGDNFDFIDTSERLFGLPDRSFHSFYQASDEAAISRLYGGIHFRDACEEGVKQGKKVGNNSLSKLAPSKIQ